MTTAALTMASFGFESLSVLTDTNSKPADRGLPHSQYYMKSVGSTNWRGYVERIAPDYINYTLVVGPQAYVYTATYGIPVYFSTEVENACLSEINEALRGQVDLAITIAQSGQVVGMQRQLFKVAKAILQFRRTFGEKTFRELPNMASEAWLAWQYGIRPVISDIYNSADNLKRTAERCVIVTKRKSARTVRSGSRNPNFLSGEFGPVEKFTEWSSQRVEIKYYCQLDNTVLQRLGDWTSLNPVSIAWELVPYSFVADWFMDIGGYLRNMESAFLYRNAFKSGYITRTFKGGIDSSVNFSRIGTDGWLNNYGLMAARIDSAKQRAVLTNVLLPHPPRFRIALGWQRLVSAASLVVSGFDRRLERDIQALTKTVRFGEKLERKLEKQRQFEQFVEKEIQVLVRPRTKTGTWTVRSVLTKRR